MWQKKIFKRKTPAPEKVGKRIVLPTSLLSNKQMRAFASRRKAKGTS